MFNPFSPQSDPRPEARLGEGPGTARTHEGAPPPTRAERFQSTWLYRLLLLGPSAKGLRCSVPDLWPGDPEIGRALVNGRFRLGDEVHTLTPQGPLPPEASPAWTAWYHGHSWLRDVGAVGTGEAPYFAREHLTAWIAANTAWSPTAWAPEVTAERLVNWCQHWNFLTRDGGRGPFEKKLCRAASRDARHLLWSIPTHNRGFARLHALKGQAFGVFALLGGEARQTQTLARLEHEISAQILPDGGHVERNPERLASVLKDLLELKALISAATGDVPQFLQNALDRAAPMLRALRHPDGGLAVFNGGRAGDNTWLDVLLAQTASTAKPPPRAPHGGFQRLTAGPVNLIMDCGQPTTVGHSHHGGTLSFEMSVGKHRMIVNCGARPERHDPWRTALAATAAHSTLSVNDTSSSTFDFSGHLRRGPQRVTCARQDVDQGTLAEASHDGYMDAFGLTHHRTVYVAAHGTDVRGEDRLVGTGGDRFTVRFHLHPGVKASLLGPGHGVLLHLADKNIWRLRTSALDVALEDSVYLGHGGEPRRTEQIVISGPLSGNGALIKWAFSREDAK